MRNQIKTVLLLGTMSGLVLGLGALVAPGYLYLFAALAVAMNFGAYFFSDRIVLRMHNATEVSESDAPELHEMVGELSARAGIPKPRIFHMAEEQPNAFATGRNPEHGVVVVTDGLVRMLERRELRGVIAHELAHIKNRDILVSTIAASAAALISYVAQMLSFNAMFGHRDDEDQSPVAALVAMFVAPLAATLIQLGISRSREFLADETGASLSDDPEALARALVKIERAATAQPADVAPATASLFIVNPFGAMTRVSRWFSTHPGTEERVERLLAMSRDAGFAPGGMPAR